MTRRYAAIDVGTNSVKLHVGERLDDGEWRTVVDRSEMTRLGEGVAETGRLGEEPIRRTVAAIAELADDARRNGAEGIAAVGTAGLRQAANAADFLAAAREQAGVEVEVISGEEEARLSVLAATDALHLGRGRSQCSRRAAAARSSPSASWAASTSSSASTSARCRSPSASGSTGPSTRRR